MSKCVSDNGTKTAGIPIPAHIVQIRAARRAEAKLVRQINDDFEAGELTPDEFKAGLREIALTRFPAGYTLGPCPPWCVTDHAGMDKFECAEGWRQHSSEPVSIPNGYTERVEYEARVDVCAMDILDTGVRQAAAVNVTLGDYLTPTNARLLAAAIERAAAVAEAWNR